MKQFEGYIHKPISIWTSNLPGRNKASSIISFLLVIPEILLKHFCYVKISLVSFVYKE